MVTKILFLWIQEVGKYIEVNVQEVPTSFFGPSYRGVIFGGQTHSGFFQNCWGQKGEFSFNNNRIRHAESDFFLTLLDLDIYRVLENTASEKESAYRIN